MARQKTTLTVEERKEALARRMQNMNEEPRRDKAKDPKPKKKKKKNKDSARMDVDDDDMSRANRKNKRAQTGPRVAAEAAAVDDSVARENRKENNRLNRQMAAGDHARVAALAGTQDGVGEESSAGVGLQSREELMQFLSKNGLTLEQITELASEPSQESPELAGQRLLFSPPEVRGRQG